MLAEGALAAGCRFFAGYPITPASEIYEVMMRELPALGGLPFPLLTKFRHSAIAWAQACEV